MNRQQKKCVIATAGVHLLLLLILIVGPAFFAPKPKADDLPVVDVIPANLVDAAFNSGVANAVPPPPAPITPPQPPPPVPAPPTPPPKVEPPKPVVPDVEKAPVPPDKPVPHKPQINTQLVTRPATKNSPTTDNSRQQQIARQKALSKALKTLKTSLTTATTVDMPGNSSVAYANYASAVKSIYDDAWTLPDHINNDEEITKVSVTIASDGTVITASIVTPSGDANVDATVQRALARVKFIAPFPEGTTDKERTYIINFNPKTKKMLE